MRRLLSLPLFVVLMGVGAIAMMVPALHAFALGAEEIARTFLYGAVVAGFLTAMIAVATAGTPPQRPARAQLLSLAGAFTVLPAMFAVPFHAAVQGTGFLSAWFEMVSCFTTTGASLYPPERLHPSVHVWRGLVGWTGGLFVWIAAAALLAPMNLGGFEVAYEGSAGRGAAQGAARGFRQGEAGRRLVSVTLALAPVYAALTAILWLMLLLTGTRPTPALILAMSTLATSGISPGGSIEGSGAGVAAEGALSLFLLFGLTRALFSGLGQTGWGQRLRRDPELRLGLLIVAGVTGLLFLRHWLGAADIGTEGETVSVLSALWGLAFTVLSFVTTTGFVSSQWAAAEAWSGLSTPGLLLMALAIVGGGVGTTAGGVKLLRSWALYKHTLRELERVIHPSSVGGEGPEARRLRREGAEIAWIFFMLFALSIALVCAAFAATGLSFDVSLALTVATLSTTGPLTDVALAQPIDLLTLSEAAKIVAMVAMVLGRLETLALIALFNPDFWRL